MIVTKEIKLRNLILFTSHHIIWLLLWMGSIAVLYHYKVIYMRIPWLPLSVIGTAVAFFLGFKNNQAYNRLWEARKIWGGIVNESRSWGMMVNAYVTNLFRTEALEEQELSMLKKRLIYRHMAWLYVHRQQLLRPTPWEHVSQGWLMSMTAQRYQNKFGIGLLDKEEQHVDLSNFLNKEEYRRMEGYANTATQLINTQSEDLRLLRERELLDDFRHMELENLLRSFYTLQGKNERIKKFPLPRFQANLSRIFVGIFIFLLPFSMIPEMMDVGHWALQMAVPITALVGWVYVMMEIVGDYSENPFQGMANDIPMMALCRTIEIDLREMLGEKDLPQPIKAKRGILM